MQDEINQSIAENTLQDPIYSEGAFQNELYIFEDRKTTLVPHEMIRMIMNHIKKDIQFQKEQVKNETVKKRLFMQQKRALEQAKRAGGKEAEIKE